ncbi:MAG: hypothetical protein JXR46_03965 [Calditrichaceae bacterium]|nr:hypothetical protein [Calditrichaceae bacterium]MBN2708182.1 hypothetical protein [Calditrichaceae bacterium]RQV97180.1 MAG: hypothetical protein EH224_02305 [Calditrichota bacterium]
MRKIEKYSFGIGDRFNHQAKAQLSALIEAEKTGIHIVPVWNKSYREHSIISSIPLSTREQADKAVKTLKWRNSYYVDADHVGLVNVDFFIDAADFYTLDVADFIGKAIDPESINHFIESHRQYIGKLIIPGIEESFDVSETFLRIVAGKYLLAAHEAGKIFRHISSQKDVDKIIIEVSMDETNDPQTPLELFFILSALAMEKIPLQTIAPKFSGRFNKGVDYVGDINAFKTEFGNDLAVLRFAVSEFGLSENLKLSVHSGSDKFSIYPVINETVRKFDAGLHLKTAGTTWLEELIGLAEAGGNGLKIAKDIYAASLQKYDILVAPYATVIDIRRDQLPGAEEVSRWTSEQYVNALRHDPANPDYNMNLRQLLHVGYKIAADMEKKFTDALEEHEKVISRNVKMNILERHVKPIFSGLKK